VATPRAPKRPLSWLSWGVFAGSLVPLVFLLGRVGLGTLGAEPVALALNQLGVLALIFLVASLACSPLKIVFGWTWPMRLRRMLGLFAFFYASLHFLTYALIDQGANLSAIVADVTKREFQIKGLIAFVLLVPLALTSTTGAVQRLGFARWKLLHRLAYVAGFFGVVHAIGGVKKDRTVPFVYAAVLAVLLAIRAVSYLRSRLAAARKGPPRRPPPALSQPLGS
jgi:sulfoxide reductase heme-binding subunit YedZ